jgi:hypothetical protein
MTSHLIHSVFDAGFDSERADARFRRHRELRREVFFFRENFQKQSQLSQRQPDGDVADAGIWRRIIGGLIRDDVAIRAKIRRFNLAFREHLY